MLIYLTAFANIEMCDDIKKSLSNSIQFMVIWFINMTNYDITIYIYIYIIYIYIIYILYIYIYEP